MRPPSVWLFPSESRPLPPTVRRMGSPGVWKHVPRRKTGHLRDVFKSRGKKKPVVVDVSFLYVCG